MSFLTAILPRPQSLVRILVLYIVSTLYFKYVFILRYVNCCNDSKVIRAKECVCIITHILDIGR